MSTKIKFNESLVKELYERGLTVPQMRKEMGLVNTQPLYKYLKLQTWYIPYNNGRNPHLTYTLNRNYFDNIDTEEKAYILGFIAADGYVADNRIKIILNIKDIDILQKIKIELNYSGNIKFVNNRLNPYTKQYTSMHCSIDLCSVELATTLRKYGLDSQKTYSLDERIISNIPIHLMRHFLRGYFDGDGNVSFGKKYTSGIKYNINVCGTKEFLLHSFQKFFPSTNKMYYDPKTRSMHVWKISKKENVIDFLIYLYKDSHIYLDRKHKVFLQACNVPM